MTTDQPTPTSSLEEARRRVERAWYLYDGCVDRDEVEAAVKALARAEVIREVEAVLTNQDGCDCDSAYEAERGFAPRDAVDHAGDCPVMKRWDEFRARLRVLSQGGEGKA